MESHSKTSRLLQQAWGAFLWAAFLIFVPFDLLLLGAVLWLPLLIRRERMRAVRFGFWPGFVVRLGIIAGSITTAALVPNKLEDKVIGPFPNRDVTLGQLVSARVIHPLYHPQSATMHVVLPSTMPTRREVMEAIARQTGFRTSIHHCASGATVFFGSGVGKISVSDWRARDEQANGNVR